MRRRATIRPAPARSWMPTPAPGTAASPPRRRWTSPPRSRRGTRPCTRRSTSRGQRGKAPGQVEEAIRGAHVSTLDWRTLLRRYMTDAASHDYSWSVPNRRFIDDGLYLPSIRSEGIRTIAVIVDTSGSLPTATLAAFLGRAARARGRDPARDRDRAPGRRRRAGTRPRYAAEYAPDDLPDEIAVKGRGGTDFRPGFEWLDAQGIQPGVCLCTLRRQGVPRLPRGPSLRSRFCSAITARTTVHGGAPRPGASTSGSPPDTRWRDGAPAPFDPPSHHTTTRGSPHDAQRHLPVLRLERTGRPLRPARERPGARRAGRHDAGRRMPQVQRLGDARRGQARAVHPHRDHTGPRSAPRISGFARPPRRSPCVMSTANDAYTYRVQDMGHDGWAYPVSVDGRGLSSRRGRRHGARSPPRGRPRCRPAGNHRSGCSRRRNAGR